MCLIKSIFVRVMLNLLKYNLNKLFYFILFYWLNLKYVLFIEFMKNITLFEQKNI